MMALLMLISAGTTACFPHAIARDASHDRTPIATSLAEPNTTHQSQKHTGHHRGYSHCHGDATDIRSLNSVRASCETAILSVEVELLRTGRSPPVTLRPPIA